MDHHPITTAFTGPPRPADEIGVSYTLFASGIRPAEGGERKIESLAAFAAWRRERGTEIAPRGDKLKAPVATAALFRDGRRRAESVEAIAWLFLDSDAGSESWDATLAALRAAGAAYIAHESCSHGIDGAQKWHVLLPLAQPIAPAHDHQDQYLHLSAALAALAGHPGYDPRCKDPARAAIVGQRLGRYDAARRVECSGGACLDWAAALEATGYVARPVPARPQDASGDDGRAVGASRSVRPAARGSGAAATLPEWLGGDRWFTADEFEESHERALAYLSADRTPVSISERGGDDALYAIAVKLLRGFPLASRERIAKMRARDAEIWAPQDMVGSYRVRCTDAIEEAHRMIAATWNPRCMAADGATPEPWSDQRITYKLEQAAMASRLRGPDFWLFDAKCKKNEPPALAGVEGSNDVNSDNGKVAPMTGNVKIDLLSIGRAAFGGAHDEDHGTASAATDWRPISPDDLPPRPTDREVCRLALSDDGDAERLVHRYGRYLRFDGQWYVWDGRVWVCDELAARRLAIQTVRLISDEAKWLAERASTEDDDDRIKAMRKHAHRAQSDRHYSAMMRVASTHRDLRVDGGAWDARPGLLSCTNGTLDLATGAIRRHDPADLITRMLPVAYRPGAECPLWESFISTSMDGDASMMAYLRRLAGLCLTGDVSDEAMHIHYGDGANGKSTFFKVLTKILGAYAGFVPPALYLSSLGKDTDAGLLSAKKALRGLRLAVAAETRAGAVLDDQTIKEVTSRDLITAKGMRENYVSFEPSHHSHLLLNNRPGVKAVDGGTWRRLRVVHWSHVVPESDRDYHLDDKLIAEGEGILVWALAGLADYRAQGLADPERVRAESARMRSLSDPLGDFAADVVEIHPDSSRMSTEDLIEEGYALQVSELRALYVETATAQGVEVAPPAKFAAVLESRGLRRERLSLPGRQQARYWIGVRLAGAQPGVSFAVEKQAILTMAARIADPVRREKAISTISAIRHAESLPIVRSKVEAIIAAQNTN